MWFVCIWLLGILMMFWTIYWLFSLKKYPLCSDHSNMHQIISFLWLNFWSFSYISDIFYSSTFQFLCSWLFVWWYSLSFLRSSYFLCTEMEHHKWFGNLSFLLSALLASFLKITGYWYIGWLLKFLFCPVAGYFHGHVLSWHVCHCL